MASCNARKPDSVMRCERAKGHRGFHRSRLEPTSAWIEWPSHKQEQRARMSGSSPDQDYRTGVLHGIMAERLQQEMERTGRFYCEGGCNRSWSDVHQAMRDCAPAHLQPRAKRPLKKSDIFQSEDAPVNIRMTCIECNAKVDVRSAAH